MINDEAVDVIKAEEDKAYEVIIFDSLKNKDIKTIWNQWKVVSLLLTMFSYCVINVIK